MSDLRLGVDIGGTRTKLAVLEGGRIVYRSSIASRRETAEALADAVAEEIARVRTLYAVESIGVGVAGCIANRLVYADNLPLKHTPLQAMLESRLGSPLLLDNDANCAALGELCFGQTGGHTDMILITLGTGVGGGIIMDGRIRRGRGAMGEIGHMIVQAEGGLPCPCGQRGCLEMYASVTALLRMAGEAIADAPNDLLAHLVKGGELLDGKLFFRALQEGSPAAKRVFDRYAGWVAVGIDSLCNIFDPDIFILSGGITAEGELLLGALREKVHTASEIAVSRLQNDAGCMGAAMLWHNAKMAEA